MDDGMQWIDERAMRNRTTMSRFEFNVGEVSPVFRKR